VKFNPKDLQNKLVFAIKSICVYIDDMSLFEESLNLTDDEFELDEFDEEISEQSEIKMFFP